MKPSSDDFYAQLPGFSEFSDLNRLGNYRPLPRDWFVAMADIEDSTAAINKGKYKDVNCASAATIMAVLNAVAPLKVPYVFGGDGATLCVPQSKKAAAASALLAAKQMTSRAFGLHLRTGMVPVAHIAEKGLQVLLGKYQPSEHFQQAMLIGEGIQYAEDLIKFPQSSSPSFSMDDNEAVAEGNFDGFECRWSQILSPVEEDVAIIIQALDKDDAVKSRIYRDITARIQEIYGGEQYHHPIRTGNLNVALSFAKLSNEARVKANGKLSRYFGLLTKTFLLVAAGHWMMKKDITTGRTQWGTYKDRLINNTDYRRLENCLKLLIAGSRQQQNQLRTYLDTRRTHGEIVYGIHASPAATVTCLVFNYDQDHVHFIDGSDGGFSQAAVEMKRQLKQLT